jgi:hypothetical protein
MRRVFKDVRGGAEEAVQDMIEPDRWAVTVFVAPGHLGYRLLVTFDGERLKAGIPGSVDAQPSPRVAVRNWVGTFLANEAKKRGVAGRRTIDNYEREGKGAAPSGTSPGQAAGGRRWRWGAAPFRLA